MENIILVPTNKYQTPITESLLSQYPDEVREQFMEFISTVPFIQNLISPLRPKIEELPRDSKGRAIIDLTNPPVLFLDPIATLIVNIGSFGIGKQTDVIMGY